MLYNSIVIIFSISPLIIQKSLEPWLVVYTLYSIVIVINIYIRTLLTA